MKWIVYEVANTEEEQPIAWRCSECGEVVSAKHPYCPNCGEKAANGDRPHESIDWSGE